MKSIVEYNKSNMALWPKFKQTAKQIFTYDWVFSSWIEKIIISAATLWSAFSIVKILLRI